MRTRNINFKPGDRLTITPIAPALRKSLPASKIRFNTVVISKDHGRSGGLDVYDGIDDDGDEISFYGTQVIQARRVGKSGRAINRVAVVRKK